MSMAPQTYYLPDTLRNRPWKRPHYTACRAESVAWIESFHPFPQQAQHTFNRTESSLLGSLSAPYADHYNTRISCDLMTLFFVLDAYTDHRDRSSTQMLCDATIDAIVDPDKPRPESESVIGEITRQFILAACQPRGLQERFITTWRAYVNSLVVRAERRSLSYICTIDEYMTARRQNIATYATFAMVEVFLKVDIPREVMEHLAIVSLEGDATCTIFLTNDMCSYKKEVLNDDSDYNAVTVVMVNKDTDICGAVQWISDRHNEIAKMEYHFGVRPEAIDRQVAAYVDGLGHWVRGNDQWSFESARYFGDEELEIQRSCRVVLA